MSRVPQYVHTIDVECDVADITNALDSTVFIVHIVTACIDRSRQHEEYQAMRNKPKRFLPTPLRAVNHISGQAKQEIENEEYHYGGHEVLNRRQEPQDRCNDIDYNNLNLVHCPECIMVPLHKEREHDCDTASYGIGKQVL